MGDTETRFRLTLQYDGSAYHGWQIQPRDATIQGELEAILTRITGKRRPVEGSGRTDTGVHATGQVAAVTLPQPWDEESLHRALNALLPKDIWIEEVRKVPLSFHPRFDATTRTYRYRVGTDPACRSPFHHRWCWPLGEPLDEARLEACAEDLLPQRNFRPFAKSGQPERGYDCRIYGSGWTPWSLGWDFTITANRYLHHMVRYLVGTMVDLARGRRDPEDWKRLLAAESGVETSPPAPASGLFLEHVAYGALEPVPEGIVSAPAGPPTAEQERG